MEYINNPIEEITIKKAMLMVSDWTKSTAQRRISQCRDALKHSKKAVVSVEEFKKYWEIV